jgi:hypothetical protein
VIDNMASRTARREERALGLGCMVFIPGRTMSNKIYLDTWVKPV